jgi:hypothetical protein
VSEFDLETDGWSESAARSMEPSRALRSGHEEAGRCFMAWLSVVGLAAEIDDLRFQEEGRIVPAPGLELLRDRGEEASREAADAVGAIGRLCGCTVAEQVDLAVRADLDRRIGNASRSARLATSQAQRALRQLAQLAFGVSAFTIGGDRIERLDMAAVAVLHPPLGAGSAVSMVEDGVDLWSRTLPELEIEVAGMLCRVLVDRRTGLLLRSQGQEVSFTVDGGDTLRGRAALAGVERRHMEAMGWKVGPDDEWTMELPSPVTASMPARAAVGALRHGGLRRVEDLSVQVETATG